MKSNIGLIPILLVGLLSTPPAQSQPNSDQNTTPSQKSAPTKEKGRSAGGDIGSGSGDVGKGAAKGAADLVTLHPINAVGAVGKGGTAAGKNIGVGTVKGTGKIAKGIGKGIKHIF